MLPYIYIAQTPVILDLKVVYCKLLTVPKWCTKFEAASFNGCRNKYGVLNFLDAPIDQTTVDFGPKSCFLVSYSPNPSCIPNLKLLASAAAKISRESQIFGCSSSPDPRQFWS